MSDPQKIEIKIKNDNTRKTIEAMKKQLQVGLMACGAKAEGYEKEECPVDTGRLRNSITWAIRGKQSKPNTSQGAEARSEDYKLRGEPPEAELYIGTNVEYAPKQEYGDAITHKVGKAHFLRDSFSTHIDEYQKTLEAALNA